MQKRTISFTKFSEKKLSWSTERQFKTEPKLFHRRHETTSITWTKSIVIKLQLIVKICRKRQTVQKQIKTDKSSFTNLAAILHRSELACTWLMVSSVLKYCFKKFRIHTVCFLHLGEYTFWFNCSWRSKSRQTGENFTAAVDLFGEWSAVVVSNTLLVSVAGYGHNMSVCDHHMQSQRWTTVWLHFWRKSEILNSESVQTCFRHQILSTLTPSPVHMYRFWCTLTPYKEVTRICQLCYNSIF